MDIRIRFLIVQTSIKDVIPWNMINKWLVAGMVYYWVYSLPLWMAITRLFISVCILMKKTLKQSGQAHLSHHPIEDTAAPHVWQTGCPLYAYLKSKMGLENEFLVVSNYFLSSVPGSQGVITCPLPIQDTVPVQKIQQFSQLPIRCMATIVWLVLSDVWCVQTFILS